jgi:hypothetical protein
MQYHALSLCCSDRVRAVHVIGYGGSPLIPQLTSASQLICHAVQSSPPAVIARFLPRLLRLAVKLLLLVTQLAWQMLVALPRPDVILVQVGVH